MLPSKPKAEGSKWAIYVLLQSYVCCAYSFLNSESYVFVAFLVPLINVPFEAALIGYRFCSWWRSLWSKCCTIAIIALVPLCACSVRLQVIQSSQRTGLGECLSARKYRNAHPSMMFSFTVNKEGQQRSCCPTALPVTTARHRVARTVHTTLILAD